MKIHLNLDRCEGFQQCHAVDEDLFPLTDEGVSAIVSGQDVPEGSAGLALEGVEACPLMALRLE